jgi:hypothetical protein
LIYLVELLAFEEGLAVEAAPGDRLFVFSGSGGRHSVLLALPAAGNVPGNK